jgi:hypothetical protein
MFFEGLVKFTIYVDIFNIWYHIIVGVKKYILIR